MTQKKSTSDTIVFTEFQKKIAEFILDTHAPGKHSARNAILCIEKAWQLRHIDANMSAEEEAATAIFHALKRRKYKGADKLNHKRHLHKLALLPFLKGSVFVHS